jgi:hypothetical protein
VTGDFWPDPVQELLLRVAVGSQASAAEAYPQLVERLDLVGPVDGQTVSLLPMLYRRLRLEDWSHPKLPILKGVYMRSWYANRLAFTDAAQALQILESEGLPTMVLKGAVLAIDHYQDAGARPMADVDVLIPHDACNRAVSALEAKGWTRVEPVMYGEVHLMSPRGAFCDLHWALQPELEPPEGPMRSADDFWSSAIDFEIEGVKTLRPSQSDLLVHGCVHGARWADGTHIIWLADTAVLLSTSVIDEGRLLAQSEKRRCLLAVSETLRYARDILNTPAPGSILERFEAARPPLRDRLLYTGRGFDPHRGKMRRTLYVIGEYLVRNRQTSWPRLIAGFPAYVRDNLGLRSMFQVPFRVVRLALRRRSPG